MQEAVLSGQDRAIQETEQRIAELKNLLTDQLDCKLI